MFRHPLPSTGSPGVGSPAPAVLRGAPTPCRPSRRTSFPSLGGTAPALDASLPGIASALPWAWACSAGCPTRSTSTETTRPLRFLGDPHAYMPRSLTPARSPRPAYLGVSMLPSVEANDVGSRGIIFRGSMTRPARSLCTLRRADHSASTQHSVPAGGQPLPGGTRCPLGPVERFQSVTITSRPPLPGFP